ncbi:MAG TPA: hypothetical protein VM577_14785, partial [Anaerovoracaceae bacterium]|nr:hypothetical protein [Anaerovoracaceae bacterium]
MSTNSTAVFSKDFIKTVVGYLTAETKNGSALTRPELSKFIRKQYGRKLDYSELNMWLSASVNMGLFNTDDARFITKRGVKGGIVMVGAKAPSATPAPAAPAKKRAARKPRIAKAVAAPAPVAPVQETPAETA